MDSKHKSIPQTISAITREAIKTTTALLVSSLPVGQETLLASSEYDSLK